MKVLVSGGGTAGHINPALAIAGRLRDVYHSEILFVGKENGMESTLVPKEGFPISYIDVAGLIRKPTPKNFAVLAKYMRAIKDAGRIIDEFRPDAVVGCGGYVCAPVMEAARKRKIPILIHEQNVIPGMTVKMSARFADCVAVSFEDTKLYVKEKIRPRCSLTGNPLRENMLDLSYAKAREKLGLDDKPFIVTVGGSLGARTINHALITLVSGLDTEKVHILGGTGERFYEEVKNALPKEKLTENVTVSPYIYDMQTVLPAADLVVARAGAITVSELCALGRPSVLIPSPNVTHNHQEHNAASCQKHGASIMIPERDLTDEYLLKTVKDLIDHPEKREKMSQCAKDMAICDGTKRICEIVAGFVKQ